ncbi:MAG TPA: M20 family metallopeptidase [Vicinamibacterales bacterium]|jgi:glutamate carboxypeptidase|nr:M20 family metallopeptidase [Vicinamibacterales bacterium]
MPPIIDLHDFCRANRDWILETTEALVRIESPTTDKAAVDRCGAELAARLESIGGRVSRLPRTDRGDHLLAEFGCGTSQILLLGHFDTVWPVGQLDRMPLARSGGRLHGPGVFDMKAGIAIAMLATRALLETGAAINHRIVMLWTTDEEVGSASSRAAIEDEARRSSAVLVLEPSLPGGAVKTSRKGCGSYQVTVRGVAAHAGIEPQKGASAVQELAQQILRINALQDLARGVSVNVVQVSGGLRSNVIPDEARAVVDVRVPTAAAASEIDGAFRGLRPVDARTTVEADGGVDRPPLERTDLVERLYKQAREVARELGHDLAEGGTGGGSDGNFTAALGVPTLDGLGAIGDGAHALHEHIDIDTLPDRAALVAGLLTRIQ